MGHALGCHYTCSVGSLTPNRRTSLASTSADHRILQTSPREVRGVLCGRTDASEALGNDHFSDRTTKLAASGESKPLETRLHNWTQCMCNLGHGCCCGADGCTCIF